jgi:hypothetical protein
MKIEPILEVLTEDYLETYFDVVEFITEHLRGWEGKDNWSTILKKHEVQGKGGMYLLAKQWTDDFIEKYKNEVWSETLDYNDTLEEFLITQNK